MACQLQQIIIPWTFQITNRFESVWIKRIQIKDYYNIPINLSSNPTFLSKRSITILLNFVLILKLLTEADSIVGFFYLDALYINASYSNWLVQRGFLNPTKESLVETKLKFHEHILKLLANLLLAFVLNFFSTLQICKHFTVTTKTKIIVCECKF